MKKKNGRPYKEIDKVQFEKLCMLQCTRAEVCSFFCVTDKTLDQWCKRTYSGNSFSVVFSEKKALGKISLRRSGWQMAQKNPAVWIFHAKNHLGMSDKPEPDKPPEDTAKNLSDALKIMRGEMDGPNERA